MESHDIERKLAAIMSADVKGYSRLMGEDEVATIRTLTTYREVMATLIRQHRGRVVDSPGDNLLVEFASVVDAVQCAVEIQQELQRRNADLADSRRMEFRIGINLGDVVVEGEKIYGDGVNIAARLEGLADGGGICLSGIVYDQVENKLTSLNLGYEYLGEQSVKNIAKPVPVYRVRLEGEAAALTANQPVLRQASPEQSRRAQHERPINRDPLALSLSKPVLSSVEGGERTLALPDKPSLAVLPFTNLSGDPEQEYFSDGITEDLITDLSKLSGLFVIARNSTFLYKGKILKPSQVNQELGVRYMLEGSVRKSGNRVRISAQLIDTTTGYHLWAERYDRELQDIFAVQDEVTEKIVAALQVKLTEGEQQRLRRPPTNNLDAYEHFLRGLEYYWRRTREANAQARQMFERAIELDPNFAAAHAWMGRTYIVEWMFQWNEDPQILERALALAQRAADLDNSLVVARQTLAYVFLLRKQFDQAIVEAQRAVALDPNDADACITLGEIFSCTGRPQEAVGLVEKAMRLDPHYPASYLFALGQAYHLTGRYEEAITALKRVLTRNPAHLHAHFLLAIAYSEIGGTEEARAELSACRALDSTYSLERVRDRIPYRDPTIIERWVTILRALRS
ncbi:MAG: tetratricopeptide repeat protein [Deltaproteobacteria bacterium]|nr:tetratricopeptide repeat protein [Deltaproteobacteria bacterium]